MPVDRRQFLMATAAGLAAGTTSCAAKAFELPATRATPGLRPAFHSRHIPIEHLNLDMPMGKDVVRNGLCDTIKPDTLKRLRDIGVGLVEMRVVWWEIEPEPGRFDWTRTLRDMDAVLNAGLKVGMFAWLQYPPMWYDPEGKAHARYRSLGSNVDATATSLWDPKTLKSYDRLLGIIGEKLRGRLSFVYNAITGMYGEYGLGLGMNHYKFSSSNKGGEFVTGDRCARASFAQSLQKKYESLDALNRAWETRASSFEDDLMPKLPFANNPLRQRDDYVEWSVRSLDDFADRVCGLYQKHFPGVTGALPLGAVNEPPHWAQVKSHPPKLAAKYGITARWTGCAHLKSFDRSHLLARRLASAAHFYGAPFGTEAALILDADNAANALYESLANGAAIVHDDPQNIFRAEEVHRALRPKLLVDPPVCSAAVFYPVESEMLQMPGFRWKVLLERCAKLRQGTDYDVCDSDMVKDGYLATKRDLFFLTNSDIREHTAQAIVEFAAKKGRVWLFENSEVSILHQSTTLVELAAKQGLTVADAKKVGATGLVRFADWQEAASHVTFKGFQIPDHGEVCYRTRHLHHESCYLPQKQSFEIRPLVPR
jgi:hypothetical protein